jgi:phospholipase/carboxylesterase
LPNLTGPHAAPAAGGPPRQLIVLLHGRGANGQQMIEFAPEAGRALPHAVFHAPNAPEELAPGSYQWFTLGMDFARMASGARAAAAQLNAFIDAKLTEYGLPADAYALVGFSQGAMMALHIGLRRKAAPRAIIALSGLLVDPLSLRAELTHKPPVLLIHGEQDNVVPAARSREAEKVLRANQVPVETLFIPALGHSINGAALQATTGFLHKAFL